MARRFPLSALSLSVLVAPVVGVLISLILALFRMALDCAADMRETGLVGLSAAEAVMAMVIGGAMVALSAWMVRYIAPEAAGSGIPHVAGVLKGELPAARKRVVFVKFIGGWLAMAPGLAMGREGPDVQIGASIGWHFARIFNWNKAAARNLMAAGASAGFAAAFGAPLAGVLFVHEGLKRRHDKRAMLSALGAAIGAIWINRLCFGTAPELSVPDLQAPGFPSAAVYLVLGLAAGVFGIVYNRTMLRSMDFFDRLPVPPLLRAGVIGAGVVAIAIAAPQLVGSGDGLAQAALDGETPLRLLPVLLGLRLLLIAVSISAGTPGGLLLPLLSLGAELGLAVGLLCTMVLPAGAVDAQGFALVGMAALFTAVIRTPLTAVVLITEMSADATLALPMVAAVFAAMLVPTYTGDAPFLEALRKRHPVRRLINEQQAG